MTNTPKVSIITVCFNAGDALEDTIKSIISQTYPNLEYIIVDGKSTDNTMDILQKYDKSISMIISEPDSGLYDAMNKGLGIATGEYVNFMNAGDIFYDNNVITELMKGAENSSDVFYGDAIAVNPDGSESFEAGGTNLDILEKRPIYRHNASFTRLSLHKQYPFTLSKVKDFGHALDYNHIFSIWKAGATFQYINLPVLKYERVGISDQPVKNVILNFRISHQYGYKGISDYMKLIIDILRVWRRTKLRIIGKWLFNTSLL